MSDERTFVIRPLGNPTRLATWYAGSVADGRLVLARQGSQGLLGTIEIIWFDQQGNVLEADVLPIPPQKEQTQEPYYHSYLPCQYLRGILNWQKEVGFRSHPIRVRHFHVTHPFSAGLRLLLGGYYEFLRNPYEESHPNDRAYRQ